MKTVLKRITLLLLAGTLSITLIPSFDISSAQASERSETLEPSEETDDIECAYELSGIGETEDSSLLDFGIANPGYKGADFEKSVALKNLDVNEIVISWDEEVELFSVECDKEILQKDEIANIVIKPKDNIEEGEYSGILELRISDSVDKAENTIELPYIFRVSPENQVEIGSEEESENNPEQNNTESVSEENMAEAVDLTVSATNSSTQVEQNTDYATPYVTSVRDTGSGFSVSWDQVDGISNYHVLRKANNGAWEHVGYSTGSNLIDKTVKSGVTYTYTVCGVTSDGKYVLTDMDPYGKSLSYTVSVGTGSVSQVTSGIRNFTVTYQKISGAKGYEVRYALNPDMSDAVVRSLGESQTSLSVTSAGEGIYFVQCRAYKYDYAGNKIYGNWSSKRLAKYVRYDIGLSEATLESYISGVQSNQSIMAMLYAFSRIGYPYSQIKRSTGDYYDCSSLVWYAWESAGIKLTDDWVGTAAAEAQALESANREILYSQLLPGSLVFFSTSYNGRYKNITHVVMYVGNGMVVEAANSRLGVVYRKLDLNGRGTVVVCADPINGGRWVKENGEWYYYKGYVKVKNAWAKDRVGWCWLGSDGRIVKDRWIIYNGEWYHLRYNGYMSENGWAKDRYGWCWMDGSGRITKSKWIKTGGKWYYMKADGYMAANEWARDSIGWCWMNEEGEITTRKWIKDRGEWYFLKANGYMVADGWAKDNYGWCWMDSNGRVTRSSWIYWKGNWYYLNASGYMVANGWAKDSRGWCWMDADGEVTKSSWVKWDGDWYYVNASGYMVTGTQRIGGKTYRFDSAGRWI